MAIENISPEERLFKIIQEDKNSPRSSTEGRDPLPENEGPGGAERINKQKPTGGIGRFFAGLMKRGKTGEVPEEEEVFGGLFVKLQNVDPKTVNKTLIVILVVLTILVVYYAMSKRYNIERIAGAVSSIPAPPPRARTIEDFKPGQFYVEEVKRRDIFHPISEKVKTSVTKSTLQEMAKDLSLAGIYQGVYPEAMIEDKAAKKTYFLKEGDEIKGLKVKSILKDRIILRYGEEDIEIL